MATLLLRLAAPLQAWGADSKFEIRKTDREPTKSGVIGLLAAALGLRRDETGPLEELNQLRFAVRVDREGSLLVDFHTAGNPTPGEVKRARAAGRAPSPPYVTKRQYLSDAVFLVGLESKDYALLERLEYALRHPAFPLFLGRRSCPPTMPFCLGIREGDLLDVIRAEPPQGEDETRTCYRAVMDANPHKPEAVPKRDVPLSFNPIHRRYGYRAVKEYKVDLLTTKIRSIVAETEHDPFVELR